ncbi:MAG: acyltransferase [Bacteroidota bacterium]
MNSIARYYINTYRPWKNGWLTRLVYSGSGIRFGSGFRAARVPKLTLKPGCRLIIGDKVFIGAGVDLRAYENCTLQIDSKCKIDDGVRIIAANGNKVHLKSNTKIGFYSVINGGGGVEIGPDSSTYGFVYIQSSSHTATKESGFSKDGYTHRNVHIGAAVLLGSHASISPGTQIEDNAIIPPHTVI